jgi:hypothetical protein
MNYERIYNQIIQRARDEQDLRIQNKKNGHYYEGHHIIPECMGGDGRANDWLRVNQSKRHYNIVGLTAKEHFLCHQLLCLIYPDNDKILFAAWAMVNGLGKKDRYKPSARVYEELRTRFGRNRHNALKGVPKTEEHKQKLRKPKTEEHKQNMRGKVLTSEQLKARSERLMGHIVSTETRKKISEKIKGRTCSEETRKKYSNNQKTKTKCKENLKRMIESNKGRKHSEETKLKRAELLRRYYANKKLIGNHS